MGRVHFFFFRDHWLKSFFCFFTIASLIGLATGCKINSSNLKSATQTSGDTDTNAGDSLLSFSNSSSTLTQGETYDIGVDLSVAPTEAKTLNYKVSQVGASDADYPPQSGTINISPGQKHINLKFRTYNDLKWTSDKTLRLQVEKFDGKTLDGVFKDFTVKDSYQRLENVKQIVGAFQVTCALLKDGTVKCWNNSNGNYSFALSLESLSGVQQIATNGGQLCALYSNGYVYCADIDYSGLIGNFSLMGGLAQTLKISGNSIYADTGALCALQSNGQIKCWGDPSNSSINDHGLLGDGTTNSSSTPVTVQSISSAVDVSVGGNIACALLASGQVQCWGYRGLLGNASYTSTDALTPVDVSGATSAVQISAGGSGSCALISDGTVKCWGDGSTGLLGTGSPDASDVAETIPGLTQVTKVTSNADGQCALISDGSLKCWGYSMDLSDENQEPTDAYSVKPVVGLDGAAENVFVTPGGSVYVSMKNGGVQTWGYYDFFDSPFTLGVGKLLYVSKPVDMLKWMNSTSFSNLNHSDNGCTLINDGTVKCWGENIYGQGGNGVASSTRINTLTLVENLSHVTSLSQDGSVICALIDDGTVKCWGKGDAGLIGDGTVRNLSDVATTPTPVQNISNATQIATIRESHACALINDGTVKCWGRGGAGQLGDGNTTTTAYSPVTVTGLSHVTQITLGGGAPRGTSCALIDDGTVKCWGGNYYGLVGNGQGVKDYSHDATTPAPVPGLTHVVQLKMKDNQACALIDDGSVKCWGNNYSGEAGVGSSNDIINAPATVSGLKNVTQIELGSSFACALSSDYEGTVKCWGYNGQGQLGDGTFNNHRTIVSVSNLTQVKKISLGGTSACALLNNGTVKCWGSNSYGQLGSDEIEMDTNSPTPVDVLGLSNIVDIDLKGDVPCSLDGNGVYSCWGKNASNYFGHETGLSGPLSYGTPYNRLRYVGVGP